MIQTHGTAGGASVAELREATLSGEWRVLYQPVVDLRTRRCVGAEALLRWRHPLRGLLLPSQFIQLAESSGEIIPITRSVIRMVMHDLHWLRERGHDVYIGINLVAAHFLDPRIVTDLLVAACSRTISANRLLLEITERGHVDPNGEMPVAVMNRLREHGFMLAIDDFGAHEAGMTYLAHFPVSHIKLDKALVDSIAAGAEPRRALRGLVATAHELGVQVVAEGVETEAQAAFLACCGVGCGQGYAFARPMTCDDFDVFIADSLENTCGASLHRPSGQLHQ